MLRLRPKKKKVLKMLPLFCICAKGEINQNAMFRLVGAHFIIQYLNSTKLVFVLVKITTFFLTVVT